jgi:AraC family transcriptional regulator of adaptative response/methylated-DNA-[protein]-cysteine methyltransferase
MSDYERIAKAIRFITERSGDQPSLDAIAAHVHLSPFHFQRLFSRWAGVTPKRFLQTLTVERAKELLDRSESVFDTSLAVGLSSGSRLHDHFVQLEAVTPGDYKAGGKDLEIDYAVHETTFGDAFIAITQRGICDLAFVDQSEALEALRSRWPNATLRKNEASTKPFIDTIFRRDRKPDTPLSLCVTGTNFQVSVWKALLRIPSGIVTSYRDVAAAIGRPSASRAVGTAIGANPIAFLIPCHRVIQTSGGLGGYRWGIERKYAMHAWESA